MAHESKSHVGPADIDWQPGDFILCHRHDIFSRLIRFGEALRLSKTTRQYAYWNHTALVVDKQGTIVEALAKGVQVSHVSKYQHEQYTHVRVTHTTKIERENAVKFARSCVGDSYGFLTITSVALWSLVGGKFLVGLDGQEICSALVARALERFGCIFPKNPLRMTPSDLAEFFQVQIPNK